MSWLRERARPIVAKVRDHSGLMLTRSTDLDGFDRYLHRRLDDSSYRRLIAEAMRRHGNILRIELERDGVIWTTDIGDWVGVGLYADGEYEGPAIRALQSRIGRGAVVDVGANVGTTTVPFALGGRRVIAIEPVPQTFALLQTNVARNNLDARVDCVQRAVTLVSEPVEMFVTSGSGQSEVVHTQRPGFVLDTPDRPFSQFERVSVDGCPLYEVLASCNLAPSDIALVWADVQGSELAVLMTGDDLWSLGVPLYAEIAPYILGDRTAPLIEAAVQRFEGFVPEDELTRDPFAAAHPIREFGPFVDGIITYTSVLFT